MKKFEINNWNSVKFNWFNEELTAEASILEVVHIGVINEHEGMRSAGVTGDEASATASVPCTSSADRAGVGGIFLLLVHTSRNRNRQFLFCSYGEVIFGYENNYYRLTYFDNLQWWRQ